MSALPHEAFLVAIASLDGVGPARMRWLLSQGTPSEVWESIARGRLELRGAPSGVDAALARSWRSSAAKLEPEELWRRCGVLGIGVLSLGSPAYPAALAGDPDPPVLLFQKGDPNDIRARTVAIVGTRRATRYGIGAAARLGVELAMSNVSVVSGLALGIDAAAHRGALSCDDRQGSVVAVVGSSLDAPCPNSNLSLAREVAKHGVIYSEVPPGVRSAPWRFPVRNRILAALADAVVVVESGVTGGSMHTVREALARDVPVLAVPGPIDSPRSEGTNRLIADGATPCLSAEDVLITLGLNAASDVGKAAGDASLRSDRRPSPSGDAALVLELIEWRPVSVETLVEATALSVRSLAVALTWLEESGWISRSGSWVERKSC